MASEVKTNKISPAVGSDVTMGDSGDTFTFPSGAIVTNNGTSTGFGATNNIQRATGDVTIATTANYDVDGKSALIVSATPDAPRTITLCPVGETGMDACVITIVCEADATSTNKLMVVDSSANEVWTGYQKGDFVRLIVSNSAWLVVDHKETYYDHRYLTANVTIAATAVTKLTGWTSIKTVGDGWDNSNNKLTTPTGMNGYWDISFNNAADGNNPCTVPNIYVNGSSVSGWKKDGADGQGYQHSQNGISGKYYATSTQDVEFYIHNIQTGTYYAVGYVVAGAAAEWTNFTAQFTRAY